LHKKSELSAKAAEYKSQV